jgi:hypothetical protein
MGIVPNQKSMISQLNIATFAWMVFSLCMKSWGSGNGILVPGEVVEPCLVYTWLWNKGILMDTFFKSRGRGHVTPLVVSEVLSASILPHETYPRLPTLLLPLTATKFEPQRVLLAQQQRTTHLSTTRNSLNHRPNQASWKWTWEGSKHKFPMLWI